jgi:hypothetical protein
MTKGVNTIIQHLQAFDKTSHSSCGKRRHVLPLRHLPLADIRNANWMEQIPDSSLHSDTGIMVHLPSDLAEGGEQAMCGAAVFTHSHVRLPVVNIC